jgi:hypothetical protein
MDIVARSQVLDQIEGPDGCALMGRVGKIRREEENLGSHVCRRSYVLRVSRAAFSQEKS